MAGRAAGISLNLNDLPQPGKRLAIRVTKDAQRHIRAGHPWIYDQSIVSKSHRGEPGDLAVVFRENRDFLAIGLFDPYSPIQIKLLHQGKPKTIDAQFWHERVGAAVQLRAPHVADGKTTGYRVINGENDNLPGVILDRYRDTAVLKLYSAAWIPHLAQLVPAILDQVAPTNLILRLSRNTEADFGAVDLFEGQALFGEVPTEPVGFLEHGLAFEADVIDGQKTGHFLDQRDNRSRVGQLADGANVLDVFSCTGGFSVHAAAGGAAMVHSIDQSKPALDTAKHNMELNRSLPAVANCTHRVTAGDAFEELERLGQERAVYDIVVVDPPSFAKRATEVSGAIASYSRLAELALKVLRPGGLLLQASCSSRVSPEHLRAAVWAGAIDADVDIEIVDETEHSWDHPVTFPQGRYLNAIYARRAAE